MVQAPLARYLGCTSLERMHGVVCLTAHIELMPGAGQFTNWLERFDAVADYLTRATSSDAISVPVPRWMPNSLIRAGYDRYPLPVSPSRRIGIRDHAHRSVLQANGDFVASGRLPLDPAPAAGCTPARRVDYGLFIGSFDFPRRLDHPALGTPVGGGAGCCVSRRRGPFRRLSDSRRRYLFSRPSGCEDSAKALGRDRQGANCNAADQERRNAADQQRQMTGLVRLLFHFSFLHGLETRLCNDRIGGPR